MKILEIPTTEDITVYIFVNHIIAIDVNTKSKGTEYCIITQTDNNFTRLTKDKYEKYVLPYIKLNYAN